MALHATVLKQQAVAALCVKAQGFYIDATFGRGGHAALVLAQLQRDGRLMVVDRDPAAIQVAQQLAATCPQLIVEQAAFSQLGELARRHGVAGAVDGILFDLGVSSPQLDDPRRGFSFMQDGPLDMRMDNRRGVSAAQWIHSAAEAEIARVLRHYGEEKFARRIAAAIVRERQRARITSTGRLAQIVQQSHPAREANKHPATRTFQAIRIKINRELEELEQALPQAMELLAPGGRLVVISFHSLEHRIVKRFIDTQAKGDRFPRKWPVTADQLTPGMKQAGKPRRPDAAEVAINPRARSAIMRMAEKLDQDKA